MKKLILSLVILSACSSPEVEKPKPTKDRYMDSVTHYADSLKWDLYDFQDSIRQAEVEKIIKERKDAIEN